MRAVQVEEFGGPEVLLAVELPDPEPRPGEAVIDVTAADVMFLDTLLRSGWGADFFPLRPPYVPGSGVAGTSGGRRVVADTKQDVRGSESPVGGYAEIVVVPESELIPVPDGLDNQQAVALLHDGPTLQSLLDALSARPGERVLVMSAAGGAGVLLVQELTRRGVSVVAAARGAAKTDLLHSLGAAEIVDYGVSSWPRPSARWTPSSTAPGRRWAGRRSGSWPTAAASSRTGPRAASSPPPIRPRRRDAASRSPA